MLVTYPRLVETMQKALRAPSLLGWLTVHKHGLHERVLVTALCALDALVGLCEGVRIQSPQRVCVRVLREDDRGRHDRCRVGVLVVGGWWGDFATAKLAEVVAFLFSTIEITQSQDTSPFTYGGVKPSKALATYCHAERYLSS